MGYLSEFKHDLFVSYAHSDQLNDWSGRFIHELRNLVALGLRLRDAEQVGLWWDYHLRGNELLTCQLRTKVEGAGVLVVLMSDWYLDSAWCRDERNWFISDVRQRGADQVFVVHLCATDHSRWPETFKDLVGYNLARDAADTRPQASQRLAQSRELLGQQRVLGGYAKACARNRQPAESA